MLRGCFVRVEPWLQAGKYVAAVTNGMASRNGWTIAELRARTDAQRARHQQRARRRRQCTLPPECIEWYAEKVDGTYQVTMGDRGRLVIPAELRAQAGLTKGTPVVLIAAPGGVLLVGREQLKSLVREDLAGLDLVGELLADRRRQAATEDAA